MHDITIINWDEINCEAETIYPDDIKGDIGPKASDDEVIAFANAQMGHTDDSGWRMAGIARTPATATIEWRSDRNHLAVSTIIWDRG